MAAVTLDGIASGLDTATLISSLMAVEALPQTLLQARVDVTEAKITDLQSLNTQIAALATLAATDATGTALQTLTATSSSTAATAVAGGTAAAGSIDFTVTQLAQAQTSVTAAMSVWPDDPAVLTVVDSAGVATEITADSTAITDVVTAINAAGAGIIATKVAAGTDTDGTTLYRLQLTSTSTGEDGAFSVYQGSSAEVDAGTATDLLTQTGASTVRTAQNASITLWSGTDAEQSVSSTSNTFTDLLEGVDVTVSAVSTTPVSLVLTLDSEAATAVAQALVSSLSTMLGFIDTNSSTTSEEDTSGDTVTTLGSFTSDSTIRSIRQSIMTSVSAPVDGISPATIGISFDSHGSIEFDAEVFAAALAEDPEQVSAMFATISARIAEAAETASDEDEGTLTLKIEGQQTLVDNFSDQVDDWDDRLATREATLKATFVALEVSMSTLNSQSSYLTSQLASLPTWDSSD